MSADPATESPAALLRTAAEHEAAGRLLEAEACLDRCLETAPDDAEALHLKGAVIARLGRIEEAAQLIERALERQPSRPIWLRNLCEVYRLLGRNDDALRAGRASAAAAPSDPLCHVNLSVLHYARGEPEAAMACAERALALNPGIPGAHLGLAEALLLRGDFERGWEEYDWRFRIQGVQPPIPQTDKPEWDGEPLNGRVLLIADQGFGDSIQFARYIPWVAERSGSIALAASRELQPILRSIPGIETIFDRWDDAPSFDAYCTLSGLPRLHRTRLHNIPSAVPYLRADPARLATWKARLQELAAPGHLRVGLAWSGRPTHRNDVNRSMRLSDLASLGALDGVTLVSLQVGPGREQIADYFERAPLINLGAAVGDFADTLAVMECLDLVICVDTSVGHLAGAAGRAVWIMLPHACDWRWLQGRPDTPWYPTARLFRQSTPRVWSDVVDDVVAALGGVRSERDSARR